MYNLKVGENITELDTSLGTVRRMKARTGKGLNELANNMDKLDTWDIFELFADGILGDRKAFLALCEASIPPAMAASCLLDYITEINFNGLSEEKRKLEIEKNLLRLRTMASF